MYLDDSKNIKEFIRIFSSAQYIFAPTGSALIGIMFMQKNSVMLIAEAECHDLVFKGLSLTFGVFYLSFSTPNAQHFINIDFPVRLDDVIRLSYISIYALKYHCWP